MNTTMERKTFLLRLDPATMAALRSWADDDLRSLNGQMEFLLRRALREAGRLTPSARRTQARVADTPDAGGTEDTPMSDDRSANG